MFDAKEVVSCVYMDKKLEAAFAKSRSLSSEKAAEFLLSFFKLEERKLSREAQRTLRLEIARLLELLEQQKALADEFLVFDVASPELEEDFTEVASAEDAESQERPLELWRREKSRLEQSSKQQHSVVASEFVVLPVADEEDDWAMVKAPSAKKERKTRSHRELFLFCRNHFARRSNVRLGQFRRAWAENKCGQLTKSGNLLSLLAVRPKTLCSDCSQIGADLLDCEFCGTQTCRVSVTRRTRVVFFFFF
jgi:hypothetical protein